MILVLALISFSSKELLKALHYFPLSLDRNLNSKENFIQAEAHSQKRKGETKKQLINLMWFDTPYIHLQTLKNILLLNFQLLQRENYKPFFTILQEFFLQIL